ncbi:MAG: cysteine hydrolase family protein [Pseudomonadota bacterium]
MGTPALIIIDVQLAANHPKWGPRNNPDAEAHIEMLLAAWRAAGAPVIHIQDYSSDPASPYHESQPTHAFPEATGPIAGETIIGKRTSSAFASSDLERHLRGIGLNTLVFCGVHTNKCVESTVRSASDLGFDACLVSDATWTVDMKLADGTVLPAEQVHQTSLATIAGSFAQVAGTAEVIRLLAR